MKLEREDKYKIHSYNSDLNGKLTLPALTKFLQETAWLHSENMGLGYKKLLENNLTWVLYKQYIKMNKWPAWGDTITIKTWPSESDKIFCYREFEIYSQQELIGMVSSSWLVINLLSRRPVRTNKYYDDNFVGEFPILFPKIIKRKIKPFKDESNIQNQQVKMLDIDINNHVNNSLYPKWCLNNYSLDFYKNHRLLEIEQQFNLEAQYMDDLSIITNGIDKNTFEHSIKREDKELYTLRLTWEYIE